MAWNLPWIPQQGWTLGVTHERIRVRTTKRVEFVDLTWQVTELVRRSGITHGLVNVQTRHTTTAIVVNENEPLLLEDLRDRLERWAPSDTPYRHDDLERRTHNLTPEEPPNGDAHARAFVLGSSESLNVVDGLLQLGRWQRIFLVELDGERTREISLSVMGLTPAGSTGTLTARLDDLDVEPEEAVEVA